MAKTFEMQFLARATDRTNLAYYVHFHMCFQKITFLYLLLYFNLKCFIEIIRTLPIQIHKNMGDNWFLLFLNANTLHVIFLL